MKKCHLGTASIVRFLHFQALVSVKMVGKASYASTCELSLPLFITISEGLTTFQSGIFLEAHCL